MQTHSRESLLLNLDRAPDRCVSAGAARSRAPRLGPSGFFAFVDGSGGGCPFLFVCNFVFIFSLSFPPLLRKRPY